MKKVILILIIAFPILTFAEYNGVHVNFTIELKNGNQIIGYKYIAHGLNTLEYKQQLENDPKAFLFNQFTYEPGEYGYYTERLEYPYDELILYKLINPVEIKIDEIKKVEIIDLITASYAIQIIGDYTTTDQSWMNSEPIANYSDFEEMCTFETFIHITDSISTEVKDKIKHIIEEAGSKIEKEETERKSRDDNEDMDEAKIHKINEERNSKLLDFLKKNKQVKTVTVSVCSC